MFDILYVNLSVPMDKATDKYLSNLSFALSSEFSMETLCKS